VSVIPDSPQAELSYVGNCTSGKLGGYIHYLMYLITSLDPDSPLRSRSELQTRFLSLAPRAFLSAPPPPTQGEGITRSLVASSRARSAWWGLWPSEGR